MLIDIPKVLCRTRLCSLGCPPRQTSRVERRKAKLEPVLFHVKVDVAYRTSLGCPRNIFVARCVECHAFPKWIGTPS